jgi:outer membrane efflux protein
MRLHQIPLFGFLLVAIACQGPTPEFQSEDHEGSERFAAAASRAKQNIPRTRSRVPAPTLDEAARATARHDRTQELEGLIDSASRKRLEATSWLDHPTIGSARRAVAVARERFGQSRQLEELLLRYRRYLTPDREETPIVAPGVEALRGRINDAELAQAWARLRETILARHAEILRESSTHRRLTEHARITEDHIRILDDLIAVTNARIRTGGARQADLLALRGERARLGATQDGIIARQASALTRIEDLTRSEAPTPKNFLPLPFTLGDRSALKSQAHSSNPGLLAARAELARREESLRLADLNASRTPDSPDGGVRAATRSEARERVAEQRARVASLEARIDRGLAMSVADFVSATRDVEALSTTTVPDARGALEDSRAAFAGRSGSFLDLFRSTRRLLDAELALAGARDRLLRAQTDLQILLGSTQP